MVEYNENGYSRNRRGGCGMDSSASEYDQVAGRCEHGDEPSGSIKCDEYD
jgi:hypothetical protein